MGLLNKTSNFTFFLVIFITLFIPKTFDVRDVLYATDYSSIKIDSSLLREGDIIFRRGISLVSNIVLETDSRSPYSHVGIIVVDSSKLFVVHAVPDESESGIDYIRKDPLNLFLRNDRASACAVFRYSNRAEARNASRISLKYYQSKILFDDEFDLLNSKKFYCTELIWRAYKDIGVDITDNVLDTLTVPLGSNPFLLPGTLLRSKYLQQITKSSIFQ